MKLPKIGCEKKFDNVSLYIKNLYVVFPTTASSIPPSENSAISRHLSLIKSIGILSAKNNKISFDAKVFTKSGSVLAYELTVKKKVK